MKLLLDIGNTRLKWALASAEGIGEISALPHGGDPAAVLARLPELRPESIWIVQVMGAQHEAALTEASETRFRLRPTFARAAATWRELRSGYREPQRLGVDRWLAMIAAWHRHRGPACIVSAGTALTADVIAGDGQHLGGFIAAGLAAQQAATLGHTRFETREIDSVAFRDRLGTDTESCVRQGALLACVGAVREAAAQAAPDALCLITGGDAPRLLPQLGPRWQHEPALVLQGLQLLSQA